MEFIRAFILLMGILSHSSNKVALNWSRVAGVNVMIGEKIMTNSGYMEPCVILLEN
jgi:hypothetical protein